MERARQCCVSSVGPGSARCANSYPSNLTILPSAICSVPGGAGLLIDGFSRGRNAVQEFALAASVVTFPMVARLRNWATRRTRLFWSVTAVVATVGLTFAGIIFAFGENRYAFIWTNMDSRGKPASGFVHCTDCCRNRGGRRSFLQDWKTGTVRHQRRPLARRFWQSSLSAHAMAWADWRRSRRRSLADRRSADMDRLPDVSWVNPNAMTSLTAPSTQTERPLVSIVVTNYNCARYLRAAIDSALSQTWRHPRASSFALAG